MKCVICNGTLTRMDVNGLYLEVCNPCMYAWFDQEKIKLCKETDSRIDNRKLPRLDHYIVTNNCSSQLCPACNAKALTLECIGHSSVYLCQECKGCFASIATFSSRLMSFLAGLAGSG